MNLQAASNRIAALEKELARLKDMIAVQAGPQRQDQLRFPLTALIFSLHKYAFAVPVQHVTEVTHMVYIAPLPGAPEAIRGVLTYRGRIVPVVDLSISFSQQKSALTDDMLLIILNTGEQTFALPVSAIEEVTLFQEQAKDDNTKLDSLPAFVTCVLRGKDGAITCLSPEQLLAAGDLDMLSQALSGLST